MSATDFARSNLWLCPDDEPLTNRWEVVELSTLPDFQLDILAAWAEPFIQNDWCDKDEFCKEDCETLWKLEEDGPVLKYLFSAAPYAILDELRRRIGEEVIAPTNDTKSKGGRL